MLPHLGWGELLIILAIVLIVFGVGRLPEVGAALGKAIRGFHQELSEEATKEPAAEEETKKE